MASYTALTGLIADPGGTESHRYACSSIPRLSGGLKPNVKRKAFKNTGNNFPALPELNLTGPDALFSRNFLRLASAY